MAENTAETGLPAAGATHEVTHTVTVAAPAKAVYDLVADVTAWPQVFGPTVHAERLEPVDGQERIRLWAFANGEVRNWTSLRQLDPAGLRVSFRQERSSSPVAAMGGAWRLTEQADGTTLVELDHFWRAVDEDDEQAVRWIEQACDRNSTAELAALRAAAELGDTAGELSFSFEDTEEMPGADPAAVYEFLHRSDLWPQRLPHVSRLDLTEDEDGVQTMEMDTLAADGSVHTTKSVRLCFPDRIVYKQTGLPPVMTAHTGQWLFTPVDGGVRVTSRHSVVLDPAALATAFGPDTDYAGARAAVRNALGTNSRTTLRHARAHATPGENL
ncbi:aromatase/cyclase [Kitasatospora sp. NPDC058032]|uniref:aromatase/cyclase n=1 Tax=Kitasatospora sp. NPDC058032 TaxID=3346307 RepID=UPI0036DA2221